MFPATVEVNAICEPSGEKYGSISAPGVDVSLLADPPPRGTIHRSPAYSNAIESWLTVGGPHHTVLTQAVGADTVADFAHMLHTELLLIDESTTTSGFADRIRWNQAYYRLAQGLPGRG